MQSGTLNDFKNHFKTGFVFPNLFKVIFSGNEVVNKYKEILSYACKSIQLPGITFNESKYFHEGYYNKFVSGADYDTFPMNFIVDGGGEDSKIINCFDDWGALIYKDGKFGFKKDYECNLEVQILNKDGTSLYTSKLIGVYPVNITPFDLSSENKNRIMEYEINFNFLKFVE